MNKRKKSSLGFQFLVVLIITIAGAVMYIAWLKDYRTYTENLEDYTICKNSNLENAKLKLNIPTTNEVIQEHSGNKCKTEYVNVPKNKELEFTARKMAACWDMYLEGKEALFDTTDNNYCAVCSVLTFENTQEVRGLTQYLIENNAPNKGETYFQYLANTVVTNDEFNKIKNSNLNDLHAIDTSKPQSVIFVMYKDAYPGSWTGYSSTRSAVVGATAGPILTTLAVVTGYGLCSTGVGCLLGAFLVGAAGGGVTGYAIGSSYGPDMNSKIVLWPYTQEDLSKLKCTMLEGKDKLEI
ncbi:MAG: hypothetical protein AABX32_01575, partial [Nanoarchaeota archaeon]